MESIRHVTKRGGKLVEFDADKLNKWADWASQECGVYWSDIVLKALRGMYNGITTTEMQKQLIKTCVDYKDEPHSKMAARLLVGQIYKEAYGTHELPSLTNHYTSMVHRKLWDDMGYSVEELEKLNEVIDHSKDFTYSYATVKQFYDKYAVAVNDVCMESPQMAIMALCMSNYRDDTTIMDVRVKNVATMYKYLSDLCINLPTPTLNGERTSLLSSPSCCVISAADTVDSIGAAVHVAYKMTAQRAGIGIELTTRAPKDPVKGGRVSHGGKFGYYKHIDSAVKANTQVTRGGSATVTFTCLDPEFDRLIRLKSPRTHDSQRLAFMDYSVAVNKSFLKRAATRDKWMLVSPYWAPKLYDLFYSGDIDGFEKEYERVLNDTTIERKTIVNAMDLLVDIVKYRVETGRVYFTFIDNMNSHTPFKEPIRLSNLCSEIALKTSGYTDVSELYSNSLETEGEVALCFLASVVVTAFDMFSEEAEDIYYNTCKFVDNTIERCEYPFPNIEQKSKARRNIGIGLTDVAHWMAKNGYKYDTEEGRNAIHRLAERHSYLLHKASVKLARERGRCDWFDKTKYSEGWLPVDTYSKEVDNHHSQELLQDWESLRKDVLKYGVRFSVHEAMMPVESSSVFTNSTNGLYPVRSLTMYKKSRKGPVYFSAPGANSYDYQYAWDVNNLDLIKMYAIVQKFTGQSISSDVYVDYRKDGSPPISGFIKEILLAHKLGMKTFYYMNSNTDTGAHEEQQSQQDLEGCEECKL